MFPIRETPGLLTVLVTENDLHCGPCRQPDDTRFCLSNADRRHRPEAEFGVGCGPSLLVRWDAEPFSPVVLPPFTIFSTTLG